MSLKVVVNRLKLLIHRKNLDHLEIEREREIENSLYALNAKRTP